MRTSAILRIYEESGAEVLVIAGPTASGKSALGIELALQLDGEIISADSRQVYRYMDVGTGKVTVDEMQGIPHHLIDVVDPDQRFTVADFVEQSQKAIQEIQARGKVPIIVGGTGLYLTALVEGFSFAGESSVAIRKHLEKRLESEGIDVLYTELEQLDPVAAASIDKANIRYVLRALEAGLQGTVKSKAVSSLKAQNKFCIIALDIPAEELAENINKRHAQMFADNAILKETQRLLDKGYSPQLESMSSIGYKESIQLLTGAIELSQAISIVQAKARQYAKRQRTWLRRMEKRGVKIHWMNLQQGV